MKGDCLISQSWQLEWISAPQCRLCSVGGVPPDPALAVGSGVAAGQGGHWAGAAADVGLPLLRSDGTWVLNPAGMTLWHGPLTTASWCALAAFLPSVLAAVAERR